MVASALAYIAIAESEGYHDIIVSLKSSDVMTVVEAYRLYAKQADYPTHIGVTEAGKPPYAVTKSACGLGAILLDGIGDTIRVSLLGDPVPEVAACFDMQQATGRRVRKPELIACPTCGRLAIDLERIIAELEKRLEGRTTPCKVSVLGCVVNGPGEAREADIGIAAGNGKGVIFRNGEIVRHVLEAEMVDALLEEVDRWEQGHAAAAGAKAGGPGRKRLPVVSA